MIYSYKEIVHLDPPVYTESFNTSHIIEQERTKLEKQLESAPESERPKIQEKLNNLHNLCVVLGKVNERYYISVPDGYEIGEQIEACDVKKETSLERSVLNQLIDTGYAEHQRELASLDMVDGKDKLNWAQVKNFANVYSDLRAISSVVSNLAAAMPAPMVAERELTPEVPSFGEALLEKYKNDDTKLTEDLKRLGFNCGVVEVLQDVESYKQYLSNVVLSKAAKFENNLNKDMYFTSSLRFKVNGDRRTRDNIQDLITFFDAQQQGGKVSYRDYDNKEQQLTKENLQTILKEHITNGQNLYKQKWEMEQKIAAANSIEELKAISTEFTMTDFTPKQNNGLIDPFAPVA